MLNLVQIRPHIQAFLLRPGHENFVAIGAVTTKSEQSINEVPPHKRGCYFQDDYKLTLHRLVLHKIFEEIISSIKYQAVLTVRVYL